MAVPKEPALLPLPIELRLAIYEYVIIQTVSAERTYSRSSITLPSLLGACRHIRAEAIKPTSQYLENLAVNIEAQRRELKTNPAAWSKAFDLMFLAGHVRRCASSLRNSAR